MSNRDEFLARSMGMCYHEPMTIVGDGYTIYVCKHCGATPLWRPDAFIQPRFSEIKWFVVLHEWVIHNPQLSGMFFSDHNPYQYPSISPDLFANCVYEYLVEKERLGNPIEETPPAPGLVDKIKKMIGVLYEKS